MEVNKTIQKIFANWFNPNIPNFRLSVQYTIRHISGYNIIFYTLFATGPSLNRISQSDIFKFCKLVLILSQSNVTCNEITPLNINVIIFFYFFYNI